MNALKPSSNKFIKLIAFTNQNYILKNAYSSKNMLHSFAAVNNELQHKQSKQILNTSLPTINNFTVLKHYSTSNNTDEPEKIDPFKKPKLEQLLRVEEKMKDHIPKFLKETHPIGFYTPEVIFENLYYERPKITEGISAYVFELLKIRWKLNVKFSNAVIQILNIGHDEVDGTVKIRWRMRGLRGMKIFTPWKIKLWNLKDSINSEAEWHDGFSILYVRGDGRIWKHTLQRVMTQEDETVKDKKTTKNLVDVNVGPTM